MEPRDLRMRCPECSWSTVVGLEHTEGENPPLPAGVNKRVEEQFFCPNHSDIALVPVASVAKTYAPTPVLNPETMSLEDWKAKLGELEVDVEKAEAKVKRANEALKDAKDDRDARVVTLRTALRRFTHGATEESKPILDIAEQEPEQEAACNAQDPSGSCVCSLPAGHEGHHRDATGFTKDGAAIVWPKTTIELAIELQDNAYASHVKLVDRFEQFEIVLTLAAISGWTDEEYNGAIDYIEQLESGDRLAFTDEARPAHIPAPKESARNTPLAAGRKRGRRKGSMTSAQAEPIDIDPATEAAQDAQAAETANA